MSVLNASIFTARDSLVSFLIEWSGDCWTSCERSTRRRKAKFWWVLYKQTLRVAYQIGRTVFGRQRLEQRQTDFLVGVFKVVLFMEYPYVVVENILLYALTIHFHSVPFARQAGCVFILFEEEANRLTINNSRYFPLLLCLFVRRLKAGLHYATRLQAARRLRKVKGRTILLATWLIATLLAYLPMQHFAATRH